MERERERERERESDGGRRRRHLRRFRNGKEGVGGQMCLPPPERTDRLYEWLVGLVGGGGVLSLFAGRGAPANSDWKARDNLLK